MTISKLYSFLYLWFIQILITQTTVNFITHSKIQLSQHIKKSVVWSTNIVMYTFWQFWVTVYHWLLNIQPLLWKNTASRGKPWQWEKELKNIAHHTRTLRCCIFNESLLKNMYTGHTKFCFKPSKYVCITNQVPAYVLTALQAAKLGFWRSLLQNVVAALSSWKCSSSSSCTLYLPHAWVSTGDDVHWSAEMQKWPK